jgi:branched-chain amino acid transport system substrate-binding protein
MTDAHSHSPHLGFVKTVAAGAWLIAVLVLAGGCADTTSANGAFTPAIGGPADAAAGPQTPAKAFEPPAAAELPEPEVFVELPVGEPPVIPLQVPAPPESPLLIQPEDGGPIRVALLLPLTGPEKGLGRSLLDAAVMALYEIGGNNFVLLPRDTMGTPEGAQAAADSALQEGAQLILGPVFSASVAAAAVPARARGINMVAFSTDATVAGNGVFLLSFMPQKEVERVVAYAVSQGLGRIAVLAPDSPYGFAVVDALRAAAVANGGVVTQTQLYDHEGDIDLMTPVRMLADYQFRRDQLTAQRRLLQARTDDAARAELARLDDVETLGALGYDAVLIPEGGSRLRQVAPLLPFFDIDPELVRFLGTGLWDDNTLGQEPSLVGGWFAAPPPDLSQAFFDRFADIHGYRPSRIATLAYDAVALAAVLSRAEIVDFSIAAIGSTSGFAGSDGIFRFLTNGIVERGLAVMEVEPKGLKVIDPAPVTFAIN